VLLSKNKNYEKRGTYTAKTHKTNGGPKKTVGHWAKTLVSGGGGTLTLTDLPRSPCLGGGEPTVVCMDPGENWGGEGTIQSATGSNPSLVHIKKGAKKNHCQLKTTLRGSSRTLTQLRVPTQKVGLKEPSRSETLNRRKNFHKQDNNFKNTPRGLTY